MDERSDLVSGVEADTEQRSRVAGRRLVRWVTVLALGIVAVLAVWQDTLA